MEAETTFPQHFYDDTTEIFHVLHAEDGAEIGQCEQWMESLKTDSLHFFGYSAPKMIKVQKYDNFKPDQSGSYIDLIYILHRSYLDLI